MMEPTHVAKAGFSKTEIFASNEGNGFSVTGYDCKRWKHLGASPEVTEAKAVEVWNAAFSKAPYVAQGEV